MMQIEKLRKNSDLAIQYKTVFEGILNIGSNKKIKFTVPVNIYLRLL